MRVAFLHPDLGLGGAEKLVVDAALGLQARGHEVVIYTSHHDPTRCFPETQNGTLQVRVLGNLIPPSVGGRLTLLCAILRQLLLILSLCFQPSADVYIVDQLSAGIPVLRVLLNTPVLFYCHFPDLLLNPARTTSGKPPSLLRRLYRWPLDWLEESTTGQADRLVVNSAFTASVFQRTFKRIKKSPKVLHPAIDVAAYERVFLPTAVSDFLKTNSAFVSINRYENKKNLSLAIRAFASAISTNPDLASSRLLIAGGYDSRLQDNVQTYSSLQTLATHLGLTMSDSLPSTAQVIFLRNISDDEKLALLRSEHTLALLYTPTDEHFGIVPLEAMACGLPVLACDSGGPRESVQHDVSGHLLPADDPSTWASAMVQVLPRRAEMGAAGRTQASTQFSLQQMASKLDEILNDTARLPKPRDDAVTQDTLIKLAAVVGSALALFGLFALALLTDNRERVANKG